MDRNTITGLILIFIILIGYSVFMTPSQEERQRQQRVQDSLRQIQIRKADSIAALQTKREVEIARRDSLQKNHISDITKNDTLIKSEQLVQKYGAFAASAAGEDKYYTVENDVFKLTISSQGGKIVSVELKDYLTYDSLPLILFTEDSLKFGFSFFANNRLINTNDLYFQPVSDGRVDTNIDRFEVSENDSLSIRLRLLASNPGEPERYIDYVYKVYGDKYMLDYTVHMHNMNEVIDLRTDQIDLEWFVNLRHQEKSIDRFNGPTIYYKYYDDEVDYLSETKDDEESLKTRVKWISNKQPFFSSTLIAKSYFNDADIEVFTDPNQGERYLRTMRSLIGVPYERQTDELIMMSMYFGPNKYSILRKYKLDLEQQIPLGWSFFLMQWINRYAVIPVFTYLGSFGWNYGIIILVLTILLKTVLFPIAYKTYKSSAKMRVLKPEIDEINKKYPKKEDSLKKQQAIMGLYKQAGANPMAGCIPMLLQLPILLAMFRFFPSSIELRQESFLWANDLSSYDSILDLPFNIPFYGDHVSLFTLLMTASTIIYTRMNSSMMGSSNQQMPGMKTMMYLMPIMFLGLFNNYASGLSYYYLLANLITFGQMYIIRQTIDEDKIRKKIQLNKKKPPKKSKFQKRLEEMAKQRGYQPPKKK